MSKVRYNQAGYSGCSMSLNAVAAYESGEMPKSKWTKKAMLAALEDYCNENDLPFEGFNQFKKDELFSKFFYCSSWHHTGKYANETNFYSIDEHAVAEFANPTQEVEAPTAQEIEERQAAQREAWEANRKRAQAAERERRAYLDAADKFCDEHGYGHNSAQAVLQMFPELCSTQESRNGYELLVIQTPKGEWECPMSEANWASLRLKFNALDEQSLAEWAAYAEEVRNGR